MNDVHEIISNLADDIVKRGLSVPAVFFLESTKYVSFIGSQFLVFLGPIATCFINNKKYYNFSTILEEKSNIDFLIGEIERITPKIKS
ncbi:hypothetical protein OAH62_01330 [Candidatus Marinimicrobia bacterium]|nr:hypothetical protein [Candidatus Neomarinimicrobiota bacterium]